MGQAANNSRAKGLFVSSAFPELNLTANDRIQRQSTDFKRSKKTLLAAPTTGYFAEANSNLT